MLLFVFRQVLLGFCILERFVRVCTIISLRNSTEEKFCSVLKTPIVNAAQKEYEENILSGLQKNGNHVDEGPFYQTERTEFYRTYLEQMIHDGKAYHCFCTSEELTAEREEQEKRNFLHDIRENALCFSEESEHRRAQGESSVIRFRVPLERGDVVFPISFEEKSQFTFVNFLTL